MVYQFRAPTAPLAGALPVYVEVSELLIREIAAGRLADGARLPPERAMAADLGIAVGTLRKALAVLETRGLLERVQGSGNYVRANAAAGGLYSLFRLELPEGGGLPRAELIDAEPMEKPAALPPFGTADHCLRIRRRRLLNDTVVAMEEIWLDGGAGALSPDDLSPSLYETYRRVLGLTIRRVEDRVGVAPVPEWTAGRFSLAPGTAAGNVERFAWGEAAAPVEYSITTFDPARARYVQRQS